MTSESLSRVREALAGRYDVERELGAGGMATVYLAKDVKHDRPVALKVLRPELSAALGAERFHAEIKVTARLTHPHILALFDSGEAAGMLYYVMPYVEGESLRDRLTREKRLSVDDALKIARAVSDALGYAHAHEVVHRDIKPENIMLQNGHALVADFGIARAIGAAGSDRLTVTGLLMGTPLYMSPEQASGEVVIDGRSDVYSLACVLFEMLTGEAPFTGATMQAVIAKRFTQSAPSAIEKRGDVPKAIDQALQRALVRDPGERIASATQFAEMLAAAMMAAQSVAARGGKAAESETVPTIAVLPFTNMSADREAEFFSDGITEEILNALAKLSGLRVIARTSSFAFKGKAADVREIGKALGAGHILEGSVRKAGNKLRITAQLIEARSGHHLWSEKYDRDMSDVFRVQDEVTAAIREELSKHLLGIGEHQTQATPQIDAETYEMFLRGHFLVTQRTEGMHKGMKLLSEVVERAPGYAPGFAALGLAYATLGWYVALPTREAFPVAGEMARKALALDSNLALAHSIAGHVALYHDWNWPGAEQHYRRATELNPNDPHVAAGLANYLWTVGRFSEAIGHAKRAVTLDPLNGTTHTMLVLHHHLARDYEHALAAADRALEIAPGYSEVHRWRSLALERLGKLEESLSSIETAVRLSNRHVWSVCNLWYVHTMLGHSAEAQRVEDELRSRAKTELVPTHVFQIIEMFRKVPNLDRAFELFEQSIAERDFWIVMARIEPGMDNIRHDPRFEQMVAKIGIPPLTT